MKRVLYFFPDNVGRQNAGNKTRAIQLLKYFKQKGYQVDFASLKHEKADQETEQDTVNFLIDNKLADKVYLLPRKPGKGNPIVYFLKYKLWDLIYYWFAYPLKSNIPTFLTIRLKHAFEDVLKANSYDDIIISYVTCAGLVSNKSLLKGAKTIIDTHDFITAQFKYKRNFNLGVTFQDEISRLNSFDEVWAISHEEQYVFGQFCKSNVRLVPLMIDMDHITEQPVALKKYDLVYVASDNVHNKRSADWFFDKVYPLLPADIKICVIGLINKSIPAQYKIERIAYAENLDEYYAGSKIALCPMLTGTGVKVKVVEALAHGLPVVCTLRGIDGLPNKRLNGCLVSDDPAGFAANIITLLNDKAVYAAQSAFAKELFNNSFSKSVIYKELDSAFN
ncbi:glycosyltransferase [Mucilaginibacter sp. UR6-11]|uniref:glycosyltransferase n=1 Tax=Mucilaginibacter sp. UR6-11 TaxID=1435644 RepID=UPI001E2DD67C|nr:glycosyltransferase [Mucilaginibacter sp. UR6-11]MCC8424344.1 glycosyltransferase family 4 protein [Mucilaginibacter sp. UR6-11]